MTTPSRRLLGWGAFVLASLLLAVWIGLGSRSGPPARPLPEPNGYEDLAEAARLVRGEIPDAGDPSREVLAAAVGANQPALDRLRIGLSRDSLVPPFDPENAQAHLEQLGRFKMLARLVALEAELARRDREWDHLVEASTNGLAFAFRLARGGVQIDSLVATAAEAITRTPLAQSVEELPAAQARAAATALAALESSREPSDAIRLSEERYARRHIGGNFVYRIAWELFLRRRALASLAGAEAKRDARTLETRELAARLAARAYTLEQGRPPAALADVVPSYLPRIPQDPATGQPLRWPLPPVGAPR